MKLRSLLFMAFVFFVFCGAVWRLSFEKSGMIHYPASGAELVSLSAKIEAGGNPATAKLIHLGGVSTPYIIPSDVTFSELVTLEFENGAQIVPDTGIDVAIYSPENIKVGDRQHIFTGDGTVSFTQGGKVSPFWTGATGDGSTNDSPAFQAILDTLPSQSGSILDIPDPESFYSFEETVNIGEWKLINGDTNVDGTKNVHPGLMVRGPRGSNAITSDATIKYANSTSQDGDTYSVISGVSGDWNLVDNDGSIFKVVGSNQVRFENLTLDGDDKAFSGIHFDQNCKWCSVENVGIFNTSICIRLGTKYGWGATGAGSPLTASYYGYGGDPYYIANYTDYPSNGGYDSPFLRLINVFMRDSRVGLSQESSQALNTYIQNGSWNIDGVQSGAISSNYEIFAYGGSIIIKGGGISTDKDKVGLSVVDPRIRHLSGNFNLMVDSLHVEGDCDVFFQSTTTQSSPKVTITNSDLGGEDVYFRGGGGLLYMHSVTDIGDVKRDYEGGAEFYANIYNCEMNYLTSADDSGSNPPNCFIDVANIDRGVLTDAFTPIELFVGSIRNVTPNDGIDGKTEWRKKNYSSLNDINSYEDGITHTIDGVQYFNDYVSGIADETSTTIFEFDASTNSRVHTAFVEIGVRAGNNAAPIVKSESLRISIAVDDAGNISEAITPSGTGAVAIDAGATSLTTAYSVVQVGDIIKVKLVQNNEPDDSNGQISIQGKVYTFGSSARVFQDIYRSVN